MVKKTILVVFMIIVIGVFTGFNYLLLARESADVNEESLNREIREKSATIIARDEEIEDFKYKVNELNRQIITMNQNIEEKEGKVIELENTVLIREQVQKEQDVLLNEFRLSLDVEIVGKQAREWVEFLDGREYDKSFARFGREIGDSSSSMMLSEFRNYYRENINGIEIKSMEVVTDGIPSTIHNDLVILVVVDIVTPMEADRRIRMAIKEAEERANEGEGEGAGERDDDGDGTNETAGKLVDEDVNSDRTGGVDGRVGESETGTPDLTAGGTETGTGTAGLTEEPLEDDPSIFNSGENQLYFLMNFRTADEQRRISDWEITKIIQKLN